MLLCWRHPPRFGSLLCTRPLPGDDQVAEPRAGRPHLTGARLAGGYEGDKSPGQAAQGPSWAPSLHLRPPAGLRLDPETLATGREQGPVPGKACHLEPPPCRPPRGARPSWGQWFPFSFLSFFLSSWLPTARKPGPPGLGGVGREERPDGADLVPRATCF